jgi:phosphotransferase system  glucose/maltose/N-acetylglucosamine-specific IIC component
MNQKQIANAFSIFIAVITVLIFISQLIFRNTEIFNSTINSQIALFNRYTSIYWTAFTIAVISKWIGLIKNEDLDFEGSILAYLVAQLLLSYYTIEWLAVTDDRITGIITLILGYLPLILFIIRRPIKRIDNLQKTIATLESRLNDLELESNKKSN